jgi:ring-1,2-phenylacetyl-CoA epoxidase subunit PaaE
VFSQEQMDTILSSGRLSRAKIGEFLTGLIDPRSIDHAFVCGPFGVNDEAEAALLAAGIPAARIHIERFGIPLPEGGAPVRQQPREGDAAQARIVIVRDGLSREIDFRSAHPSILDAAADAGLEVPYSCKSGVCCTCRAKLLEGEVRMERNFALEKHEVAAGFVLTCQAHPLTERVVLSFDER